MLGWTVIKVYYKLDLLGARKICILMVLDLRIGLVVVFYAQSQAQLPDSQILWALY